MTGAGSVLVVDDHQLVRTSLAMALRANGLAAQQCAATGVQAVLAEVDRYPPGLVLLDLDLGRDEDGVPIDGVDAIAALRERGWSVLVVTGSGDRHQIAAAIAAGAIGAVPKSAPFGALVQTVVDAAAGQPVMSADARRQWLDLHRRHAIVTAHWARKLDMLSTREREVLHELGQGHRAAAIADEFVVSLATVRSQIRSILAKLGVSSQLEAVAMARAAADSQPADGHRHRSPPEAC